MSGNRSLVILELLEQYSHQGSGSNPLCTVAQEITGVTGAGMALRTDGHPLIGICASGPVATELLELEVTVAEGPCSDASRIESLVSEPDLSKHGGSVWPWYAPLAIEEGALAVFAFPVRLGAVRLGALLLFNERPGVLTDDQLTDGFTMATVAARAVLARQAGTASDAIAQELLSESTFDVALHQAAGMVSVQGNMSVGDALVALRAHAFVAGMSAAALSRRVVDRDVVFDPHLSEWRDQRGHQWHEQG